MRENGTEKMTHPPNLAIEVPSQIGQGIGPSTQTPMMMKSISMLKPLLSYTIRKISNSRDWVRNVNDY